MSRLDHQRSTFQRGHCFVRKFTIQTKRTGLYSRRLSMSKHCCCFGIPAAPAWYLCSMIECSTGWQKRKNFFKCISAIWTERDMLLSTKVFLLLKKLSRVLLNIVPSTIYLYCWLVKAQYWANNHSWCPLFFQWAIVAVYQSFEIQLGEPVWKDI